MQLINVVGVASLHGTFVSKFNGISGYKVLRISPSGLVQKQWNAKEKKGQWNPNPKNVRLSFFPESLKYSVPGNIEY